MPKVPLPKAKQKTWPQKQFTKDGGVSVAAKKYYGDDHSVYRTDKIILTEPLNLGSPKQVQEFLLTQGWIPTEWNIKKLPDGKKIRTSPKLTEDSYSSIKGGLGKQIALYRQLSSRHRTLTSWNNAVRPDGRIPTPIGGKAASHRVRHSLVANVPRADSESFFGKEMREVFTSRPGYCIVGVDADACQLRTLAEAMYHYGVGDDVFTAALVSGDKSQGTDPHSVNCRRLNGVLGVEFVSRTHAKTLTFGSIFGAGPDKVAGMLDCSIPMAKKILKIFFEVMPGIKPLRLKLIEDYKVKGYLSGLDGRRLYGVTNHVLLVDLMQMNESAIMEVAMCRAYKMIQEERLDAKQVMYYHDELDYEVIEAHAKRMSEIGEHSIEWAGKFLRTTVPFKGESKTGNNWAEAH